MSLDSAGEARFEVALAQAILNEVKYGVETNQLAEVSLLAAFKSRIIGIKLVEALQVLIPGLKYLSIGAILKDGVVVKTSNIAVQGPVELKARSLRGSAAHVAARKLTAFHTKKRPDEMKMKYYELQDAWDSVQATSVLTVPIPALRRYESASIAELETSAPDNSGASCNVLHSLSGAVGIVNFGLNTEDIQLEGRHGAAFQGLAQSLSPFLAYYAESALHEMAGQIGAVAQANAASAAKSRAANEENSRRPSQLTLTTAVPSPFSAVPFPADSPRTQPGQGQRQTASATHQTEVRHQLSEQVGVHSPPAKQGHAPQQQQHQSRASNPFADVASTSFTDDSPATHTSGNRQAPPPEALQQPVSPFAAAAQMSKQLLSAHVQNTSRAPSPAASSQRAEAADPVAGGAIAAPVRSVSGGAWEQQGSESSAEDAAAPATAPDFQFNGSQLDTSFVFKRKPVSSMHARRLSTTTFHQGVLHTPRHHFSHIKPMADLLDLVEDPTAAANEQGNSQNKEVTVDDHSYLSQISRRALSTPDYHITPEGPAPTLQQQMRTRSTCANAILQSGSPLHMTSSNDLWLAQSRTHSGQQQGEQRQSVQGVMYGQHVISRPRGQVDETAQSSTVETPAQSGSGNVAQQKAAAPPPTAAAVKPQHDTGNGLKSQHDTETGPKEFDSQEEECMKPSHNSQEEGCAKPSQSEDLIKVKGSTDNSIVDSREQHAFWLTFTDPQLEAKYVKWFARKIGKVDTIFLAFVLIYITQLLFFTWTLADQQSVKWPLFGYVVVPLLVLQHGDPSWYLANRPATVGGLRVALHAFLAYFVCHQPVQSFKWLDAGGLGPLCLIPMGLMVQYKLHAVLHTVACACVLIMGLTACPDEGVDNILACFIRTFPGVALASVIPSSVLYYVELISRKKFLQSPKLG